MFSLFARSSSDTIRLAAYLVFVCGAVVQIGWLLDIPILTSFFPGLPAMKRETAFAFIFWAVGAYSLTLAGWKRSHLVTASCGLIVTLIGALNLAEYVTYSAAELSATKMAPQSSFCFFFLGLSLLLIRGRAGMKLASEGAALIAVATTFAAILGYLYGAPELYGISASNSLAANTALLFIVCSAAILAANPDSRFFQILKSDTVGGAVARKLLPTVIIVPTAVGWLRLLGQGAGLYGTTFGASISIFVCVVLMFALVLYFCESMRISDEARRSTESIIAEKEERYRELFDHSPGLIYLHEVDGTMLSVNPSVLRALSISREEIVGRNLSEFLKPEYRSELLIKLRELENDGFAFGVFPATTRTGKELFWRYQSILVSPAERTPYVIGQAQDVTELVEAQRRLKNLSFTDELTGLLNRRGFLTMAEQQLKLEAHESSKRGLTLMFADMDGLKAINDLYGHEEGSEALKQLASAMRSVLRSSDLIARWGGDEFVILTIGSHDEDAASMVDRICEQIRQHNLNSGKPYQIGCSIGIAPVSIDPRSSLESQIADADEAMYEVKRKRKGRGPGVEGPRVLGHVPPLTSRSPDFRHRTAG